MIGYELENWGMVFDSWQGQESIIPQRVQTGSEAHPASYKIGTVG
jgi:hypothetical protein